MSWYNDYVAEKAAKEAEAKRKKLQQQLDTIDRQAVRPLRAVLAGTDTQADRDRIAKLETEAEALRAELAAINDTIDES